MVRVQIGGDRTRPALLGLTQHANRRADLSRSTVTTLEGVVRNERALERVQVLAICQALNRDDPGVLVRDGKGETAIDAPAIAQYGAATPLPLFAPLLATGDTQ